MTPRPVRCGCCLFLCGILLELLALETESLDDLNARPIVHLKDFRVDPGAPEGGFCTQRVPATVIWGFWVR